MIEGDFKEMGPRSVNNIVKKGDGLKSARSEFRTRKVEKAYDHLVKAGIDALVIGETELSQEVWF
jgi:6-phosphofructokinase 1